MTCPPAPATRDGHSLTVEILLSEQIDKVEIPDHADFHFTDAMSVALWMLPEETQAGSAKMFIKQKSGEYPYCIARRFNVDPGELLSLSGLSSSQGNYLSPGTVLTIPQSGHSFPGERALRSHPATFIVGSTSDAQTLYAVACYYGDVDPAAIANANGISLSTTLTTGKELSIP